MVKLKALCIIKRNNEILAIQGRDAVKNQTFYRLCGGTIEFQENSLDAVKREIREELHSELENISLVEIKENIFTYEGEPFHEIDFIYLGELVNKDLYNQDHIEVVEPYGTFMTDWVPIENIRSKEIILYPIINY